MSRYAYETSRGGTPVYLPETLTEKTPVFTENGDYQVQLVPMTTQKKKAESAAEPKEESGKTASVDYGELIPDATLRYEAQTDGMKETIILHNADAQSSYRFQLRLKNCILVPQEALTKKTVREETHIRTENGENLFLYDTENGTLAGSIPAAFMTDASGEYSGKCTYEVKKEKTEKEGNETVTVYDMTLQADEAYLSVPERSYPVAIDPTISWNECSSSAYVCRTSPGSSYTDVNTNILCVGKRDAAGDVCRSYIRFEGIHSLLKNKTVSSARLRLNTYGATTGMPVYVRRVTSAWNPKSVTYNSQPSRAGGTMGSFTTSSSAQEVTVSLPAAEINSAVAGGTWHGIELTDSPGDTNTTSAHRAWIYNSVYVNGDKMPKLEVVYTDKTAIDLPELSYNAYGQNSGWGDYAADGKTAGSLDQNDALAGFCMDLNPGGYNIGSIKYRGYFEGSGWTDWKDENMESRARNGRLMKSIAIQAYGNADGTETSWSYDVYYRIYAKNRGWLGWAKNGEEAGDYTAGSAILGIQAVIVPRLCYQEWYLSGNTPHTSAGDVYPRIPLPVGTGHRLYGIGICFSDEALRNKYVIRTTITRQSKKSVTINSGSWSSFTSTGGDANDCVSGFVIRFSDAVMLNRYDIEHMGAFTSGEEEPWRKNSSVTGTTDGNKTLEMMSVRIVPKNYDEGARACMSERFVASENGFSFYNSRYDFGYPDGYRIPRQTFIDVFGEVNGDSKYLAYGPWTGSCYGMCLTSQMFYNNIWKYSSFWGNIDKSAGSVFSLSRQLLKKSHTLTSLIEHAQISWLLIDAKIMKLYKDTDNNVSALVNTLANSTRNKYILQVSEYGDGGHAVIPLGVINKGDGNYEIRLYDVNHSGVEVFASCNTITNSFSYNNGAYKRAALIDVEQLLAACPQLESFPSIVKSEGSKARNITYDTKNTIILKKCSSYTITDANGTDISHRDDVRKILPFDDSDCISFELPDGAYTIHADGVDKNTAIFVLNSDKSIQYSLSNEGIVEVAFHEDKTLSSSVHFQDSQKHSIGIRTYDKNKNEKKEKATAKEIRITGNKKAFAIIKQ